MAQNILIISHLNPLKFNQQGYVNPLPYNWKHMEDWSYQATILDFQERAKYLHPFQKNDILFLQFLANFQPHQVEVHRCDGVVIDTFQMNYQASSIESSGLRVYKADVALSSYPEGVYKVVVKSGAPVISIIESEWFSVAELQPDTVLLEYTHNRNHYDIAFETGIQFRFRIPGGLSEYTPGNNRVVYIDQPNNIVQLSGKAFATQKLYIGGPLGVPDWVAEKVNAILLCSSITIDGKPYVAVEGAKLDATREPGYPMAGWNVEVRRTKSEIAKKFSMDGTTNSPSSVVYNIDTSAFGSKSQAAGNNIVQIESTD
jgi:hypothetical protein